MHRHDHDHDSSGQQGTIGSNQHENRRRLAWTLLVTGLFLIVEIIGGWWSNSLALLADAGHMLTDVASLALALFAIWLAGRPAPAQRTFGYYRAEILAALVNGASLLAACAWILVEAIRRFQSPVDVMGPGMFAVACGGLLVNGIAVAILHGAGTSNLNMRGAWLHVVSDMLGSVAAIVGAVCVWAWGWLWADPLVSVVIALLVLHAAWKLLAEATGVLMESAPRGIDVDEVRQAIEALDGIHGQHDLHIWAITNERICLSAHVLVSPEAAGMDILGAIQGMLRQRFGITHSTIQLEEVGRSDCVGCELREA